MGHDDARDMPSREALLIGPYGGDHVGDAAILGGVLLRLLHSHNIERGRGREL